MAPVKEPSPPITTTRLSLLISDLINFFEIKLAYDQSLKLYYLIVVVLSGLISYLLIAIFIKAFKISDIKLKY